MSLLNKETRKRVSNQEWSGVTTMQDLLRLRRLLVAVILVVSVVQTAVIFFLLR